MDCRVLVLDPDFEYLIVCTYIRGVFRGSH